MAASRNATQTVSTARTASGRLSFAKIREPLEVPDLLALQTESFDWLLGNERWQARVAAAKAEGRVKVLAFVNQATVGADEKQPAIDQNRVIATLTRVGDRWLVSDVQAF